MEQRDRRDVGGLGTGVELVEWASLAVGGLKGLETERADETRAHNNYLVTYNLTNHYYYSTGIDLSDSNNRSWV